MRAQRISAAAAAAAVRVRPDISFPDWAESVLFHESEGKFRFLPYQREPAARIFDPACNSLSLCWYSGAGKTYLFAAAYRYAVEVLQIDCLCCFPALNSVQEWFATKLRPFLAKTGGDLRIMRDISHPAPLIELSNGARIMGRGLQSAQALRQCEADWVNLEEIDGYNVEGGHEGDHLAVADRRVRNSVYAIKTRSSYPDAVGTSNIDAAVADSAAARWLVDCPRCTAPVEFTPHHLIYPAGVESARLQCPECSGLVDDGERAAASMESGRWVAGRHSINAGFTLNCMAHVGVVTHPSGNYLIQIAEELQRAELAPNRDSALKVFWNTYGAESFTVQVAEKPEVADVIAARESYAPEVALPEGCAGLFAFADPNADFIAACVLGFGVTFDDEGEPRSAVWGIEYAQFAGDIRGPKVWREFDSFTKKEWPHPLGVKLRIRKFGVDCGYGGRDEAQVRGGDSRVKRWTKARQARGVVACLGARTLGESELVGKPQITKPVGARVQRMGPDALKTRFFERYDPDTSPPPILFTDHPDAGFDAPFFDGLFNSEDATVEKAGRYSFLHYEKSKRVGTPRNEPLDCVIGALGVRMMDPKSDIGLLRALKRKVHTLQQPDDE